MRDDYDDDDYDRPRGKGKFPAAVLAAGIIWIIMGSLGVLNGLLNLLLSFRPAPPGGEAFKAGSICGAFFGMLIGGAFIFAGIQSIRGTADDTRGNSIGSIVLGVFACAIASIALIGGLLLSGRVPARGGTDAATLISTAIMLLGGCGLIAAGVMGLMGRSAYLAWKKPKRRPRRRRDDEDDDDDARPRRRSADRPRRSRDDDDDDEREQREGITDRPRRRRNDEDDD